jgi:hypothetical protein
MRIVKAFIVFWLWCHTLSGYTQPKYDQNWVFSSEFNQGQLLNMQLSFKGNTLTVDTFIGSQAVSNGDIQLTYSDSLGNLLFYTNGCRIYGADHQEIQNGGGLNPPPNTQDYLCLRDRSNFRQGALCVPLPGSKDKYLIAHLNLITQTEPVPNQLLYTIVDFSEGIHKGRVIIKNQLVEVSDFYSIAAVKHGNGRDWWIVSTHPDGRLQSYLCTDKAIQLEPEVSDMGAHVGEVTVFSPDGRWMAQMGPNNTRLQCFDRCSGTFSCPNFVQPSIPIISRAYGASFSPSSRFLYLSSRTEVYQIDLHIKASKFTPVKVGQYDDTLQTVDSPVFYRHQLAADGKIYINSANGTVFLHVINHPDSLGVACGFKQRGVRLPGVNNIVMPYFPSFLPAQPNSPCDTIESGEQVRIGAPHGPEIGITVKPNPVTDELLFVISGCTYGTLRFFDVLGREIENAGFVYRGGEARLYVGDWPSGTYIAILYSSDKYGESIKFVKI